MRRKTLGEKRIVCDANTTLANFVFSDEFTIHASDLIINDDHQIGCGAFARVFLGELRRTKVDVCSVQRIRSKSWSRVAVKQARLPTDEAR